MNATYGDFIARKLTVHPPSGLARVPALHPRLFPHQSDLARWGLKLGRAAIFANTGLGKTAMELVTADVLARETGRPSLIVCPLAVAAQTADEGLAFGLDVNVCRDASDLAAGINVVNYDRLERFDPAALGALLLDESSIIKHHDSKTLKHLLDFGRSIAFRLCFTATPAPNDWTELGTHAEFLGVCTRAEMLSEFFCHDGGETQVWRLKGHARAAFWRWVSSWGALVRSPEDLGHDGSRYNLPPCEVHDHIIPTSRETAKNAGVLFAAEARSLMDRRDARRASIDDRVAACAQMVSADSSEPWIVWCDYNAESEALTRAIPGAAEVRGSMPAEEKEARLRAFACGDVRVLVTKPSIAGWGLNWQHCARVAYVGVTDSWEAYYQSKRRVWRFGQTRPVHVHRFASEAEGAVIANLRAKEESAEEMSRALAAETRDAMRASVLGAVRSVNAYDPREPFVAPAWLHTIRDEETSQ